MGIPTKRKKKKEKKAQNQVGKRSIYIQHQYVQIYQKAYNVTRKGPCKINEKEKLTHKTTRMSTTSYKSSRKWKPENGCY